MSQPAAAISIAADVTNTSCSDVADGSINLSVSGGTSPYTYLWNNSSTTQNISDLPTGNYSVTVTDANGCQATASIMVDANVDAGPPEITCPDDAAVSCEASVLPDETGMATATDACGGDTDIDYTDNIISGTCPNNYTIERTWTATDSEGNQDQCVQIITVSDNTPPTLTFYMSWLPALNSTDTLTVSCDAMPVLVNAVTATDNCGGDIDIEFTDTQVGGGNCMDDGYWKLFYCAWTATDACNNSATFYIYVKVVDTTAPTISPLTDKTVECSDAALDWDVPTANDNCSTPTVVGVISDPVAGECSGEYSITRTWTATDDCGNTATATQTIHVIDTTPPTFNNPFPAGNVTMTAGQYAAYVPPVLTATDACSGAATVTGPVITNNNNCADWKYYLTWVATDDCGNSANFIQTINLGNTSLSCTLPSSSLICATSGQTMTVSTTGGMAPLSYNWAVVSSNSGWSISAGGNSATITLTSGTGSATFSVTVTGSNGCSSVCSQTITCTGSNDEYCTLTQGAYGNAGGSHFGYTTTGLLQYLLSMDTNGDGIADPLVVGSNGRTLIIDANDANCIIQWLPGVGTSVPLPSNNGNYTVGTNCKPGTVQTQSDGRIKNVLLAQTITLGLNLRLDPTLCYLKLNETCLTMPSGVYTQLGYNATVCDLYNLANKALGGQLSGSLGYITLALGLINDTFDECVVLCSSPKVEVVNEEDLKLGTSPVPVHEKLGVTFETPYSYPTTIEVFDMLGRLVKKYDYLSEEGSNIVEVDVNNLSEGYYILRIQFDGVMQQSKFLKLE